MICAPFALRDEIRYEAREAVAVIRELADAEPMILSGDNPAAALACANELGIRSVEAELLPQDKTSVVARLREQGLRVLFVGDGVNGAPAMAAADVGVSMGLQGSDLALTTSDVVLVRDDLEALASTLRVARRTQRSVRANLAFAATVIVALVAWDLLRTLPLPVGVAGHEGSTVVVALNGLRLLRSAAWPST